MDNQNMNNDTNYMNNVQVQPQEVVNPNQVPPVSSEPNSEQVMPQPNVNGNRFLNTAPQENTDIYANNAKEAINYTDDPSVQANLKTKKNLSISLDSKVMLIIVALIFVFIMFLPSIYEFLN